MNMPNLNDYLAGAMLANGFVWMWSLILGYFSGFFTNISPILLADASYVIYLLGGITSSYLVCKRAASRHLIVGIKLSIITWIFSLIIMLSLTAEPSIGTAFALLACFVAGDIAGAYLALKSRLKAERVQTETSENT